MPRETISLSEFTLIFCMPNVSPLTLSKYMSIFLHWSSLYVPYYSFSFSLAGTEYIW